MIGASGTGSKGSRCCDCRPGWELGIGRETLYQYLRAWL